MTQISKMQKRLNQKPEERQPLGKPNKMWDQLIETHAQILGGVDAIGSQVLQHVSWITEVPEHKKHISNEAALSILVNRVTQDILEHKTKLAAVYEKHRGKVGNAINEDEYMAVLSIHQDYLELQQVFEKNSQNTIKDLSDEIESIKAKIKKAFEEQKQLDSLVDNTGVINE
jgi:hypothetical protein